MKRLSLRTIFYLIAGFFLLLSVAGITWVLVGLPSTVALPSRLQTPSVKIVDRNGRLLYEVIDADSGRHSVVSLDVVPLACQQAIIATEDRSFYSNPGIDLVGVIRAAVINMQGGETLAGGSTITQQVARNLLLEIDERAERNIRRKLRESVLAWRLTEKYSKDEILALYLNQTYYGGMAYGIEAASQTFFGKSVERLDLAECALLAGLPQAPALYNPFTDPEASRERQIIVLTLMEKAGFITEDQAELAKRETLVFSESPYPIEAPHFVMMVRREIDRLFTPEQIYEWGGLVVRTSLDLDWQKHAERAVLHQLSELERTNTSLSHNVNNAALVALDPVTGEVLALVGSPDYFDADYGGAINMAISPRQPGSALKPLVYAAALDPGKETGGWTAATMILDVRTAFTTMDGKAYIPANYDLSEHGPVLVREALASSLNIPAVAALDHVGLSELFELSRKMGLSTLGNPEDYDLSLALGGGAVQLMELSAAYGVFANGGYRVEPVLVLDAQRPTKQLVYQSEAGGRTRVLDERVAWLISDILSDPDARRLGFGANSLLRLDRQAAVKTGTTSNFHDNWTIGYTTDLVVGVWSGNTDYQPMRDVNGLSGAAPIWHEFMRAVLSERAETDFPLPDGMTQTEICPISGLLPSDLCPYRRLEWFIEGTQPTQIATTYRQMILDSRTGELADESTPPEHRVEKVLMDLPPQAWPWAYAEGLVLYSDFSAVQSNTQLDSADDRSNETADSRLSLRLSSPADGSTYRLTPGVSVEMQRILLEAVGPPGAEQVTFWIDGVQVGEAQAAPFQVWWMLAAGKHRAWATAIGSNGEAFTSPEIGFEVIQ